MHAKFTPRSQRIFIIESPREVKCDEVEAFREINKNLEQFENKPKNNISETDKINFGNIEEVIKIKISLHIKSEIKDVIIQLFFNIIFFLSYNDMPYLSVDLVVHNLPTHPDFSPVQQKRRKLKPDVHKMIKEEMMKQVNVNVIQVIH